MLQQIVLTIDMICVSGFLDLVQLACVSRVREFQAHY